jgi:hypothetical protein
MFQAKDFRLRVRKITAIQALFAAVFAIAIIAGSTTMTSAQEKLTPAQQQSMGQCLVTCKKGDASCQNACTNKIASPAYSSAAGQCVRACADALAVPGQQDKARVDDLVQCVRACN